MATAAPGVVVIPACNEAGTIAAGLTSLLAGSEPGELDVVVVCNGCTDDTADVARATAGRLGRAVRVVEIVEGGKAGALRAAEQLALPYPRLYLDADVLCPTSTARALLRAVAGDHRLAVPTRRLDLTGADVLARSYYRTWTALPWVQAQLAGRGAYAVSEALRAVFAQFPDVVADDRLVTTAVPADRAVIVEDAVTVRPPGSIRDVVRVRSRVYAGNATVAAPAHDQSTGRRFTGLLWVARRPTRWFGVALFALVSAIAKTRARRAVRQGAPRWDREAQREVAA